MNRGKERGVRRTLYIYIETIQHIYVYKKLYVHIYIVKRRRLMGF